MHKFYVWTILLPSIPGLFTAHNGVEEDADIECHICEKYGLVGPKNSVCETCNEENPEMKIDFPEGEDHHSVCLYDIFGGPDSPLDSEEEVPSQFQVINTGRYIERHSNKF